MSRITYLDIDELNDRLSELEDLELNVASAQSEYDDCPHGDKDELDNLRDALEEAESNFSKEDREELKQLRELKDQIGESRGKISDDGGPFIREDCFEDYARELAEEIGAIPNDASWPCTCIDWEQAANELKMGYTSVEWGGDTYYYRP